MQQRVSSTQVDIEIRAELADSFEIVPGRADAGLVVLCDHAGNVLPPRYGTLGLSPAQLQRHIAYDIGAAGVTRAIAAALEAPAVLTRFSRLLIDPNRGLDDPTLVMRLSDGAIIPGNRELDEAERRHRIEFYHRPYHEAITRVIDTCASTANAPSLLAVHSFTDTWKGVARPWAASVLWETDPRLAVPLLTAMRALPGLVIGENQPYPGQYEGDTLWQHGTQRGLAYAVVEIRQDLIASAAGQQQWGRRIAGLLRDLLSTPTSPSRPICRNGAWSPTS